MATQVLVTPSSGLRTWNATLWVAQISLAWMFGVVGVMRAFMPIGWLAQHQLAWADPSNAWWVRGTGYALLGVALALTLPGLLRVGTRLVPATAIFMGLVMVIAASSHIVRRDPKMLLVDVLVAAGCAVIAWGRSKKVPFEDDPEVGRL